MWLFTDAGMIAVTRHPEDSETLILRARLPGDIERLVHGVNAIESTNPADDYRYSATVPEYQFCAALFDTIRKIKPGELDPIGNRRRRAYQQCWQAMRAAQLEQVESDGY